MFVLEEENEMRFRLELYMLWFFRVDFMGVFLSFVNGLIGE